MRSASRDQVVKDILKTTFYVLAIVLNLLLLFILWRNPIKRFRNAPSYIIANIAVADIVAAAGGLANCVAIFKETTSRIIDIFGCISTAGLQSSFILISSLAFDRYLAISHPYKYREIFGQRRWCIILNATPWIISWIISPLIYFAELGQLYNRLALHFLLMTDTVIQILITLIFYPLNYINYMRAQKRLKSSGAQIQMTSQDLRLAQQLNLTWMIVASVLSIVMIPNVYFLFINYRQCIACLLDVNFIKFWSGYQVIVPVVLFVNPLVYAWRLPLYRKALQRLLRSVVSQLRKGQQQNSTTCSTDAVFATKLMTPTFTPTMV